MNPTLFFRFVERGGTDKHPGFYRVLQQWWEREWANQDPRGQWRDVPFVDDGSEGPPRDWTDPFSAVMD